MIKLRLNLCLCLALFSLVASAQSPHHHHTSTAADVSTAPHSGLDIPDVLLLDQHGKKVHFYTDLVKGKVVALTFIFTTCPTICPPMGATFAKAQKLMGSRVGKDVHLISVTLDPATDAPERLRGWAAKFDARPGWTW